MDEDGRLFVLYVGAGGENVVVADAVTSDAALAAHEAMDGPPDEAAARGDHLVMDQSFLGAGASIAAAYGCVAVVPAGANEVVGAAACSFLGTAKEMI